ncbi:MAG: PAS domain S-box protein [Acidobacteriaceae bacterium]|nr:PAS domain S-box protein [Acidobacteriaceae bacterium]
MNVSPITLEFPAANALDLSVPAPVHGDALLAAIVQSSDDAIISKDLNGIIRSWNRGAERIFGYTPEEAIGKPVSLLAVPERATEFLNILERIKRGERVDHYETKRRTKDGRVVTVSLTVSPIRDTSGLVIGASKIARDITDQKRLAELQQQLAGIVESSDDVIISKDLDGIIRSWNRGAERIFGYTAEETIGRHISMLATAERVDEIPAILARIRKGERIDHYETQRRTKDGRILTVSLTISPIRDASGTVIGASKIARDITERKRAEEMRERLASIVESSDDAIISKDLNGIILTWNKGAQRIFGYTEEETIGRHISMLAVPETVEEIPDILEHIRRGERVDHYETKRRTKDGRVLNISLTVSPIRDASGTIVGASKIARDITDRKRLENALDYQSRKLVARERYLETVLESMPECITVLNPAGEVLAINKSGLEMLDADSPQQVIGSCFYPLVLETDRAVFRGLTEGVFAGSAGGSLQFPVTGLKGNARIFETKIVPLRDDADDVIGALCATRDVTERERTAKTLQHSEARFRAAVTAVSSLIWTNNATGEMAGEQPGWAAFTGQSYPEYQLYGWVDAVHPDDRQPTVDAWKQALAERRMFAFEHRVRRNDGEYRLFSVRAVPVTDRAGNIREWVGVHTDITEERRLIEDRALALEREQKARQTAELLNKIGLLLAGELDTRVLTQKVTDIATELVGAQFGALFHNVTNEAGESYLLYTISGVPRENFSQFPMPRATRLFAPTFVGEGIIRCDDVLEDPRYGHSAPYFGMPKGHLPVRSYLAAPVMSRSGEVLGGLFFGHEKVGVFTAAHEHLLAGIAAQAAIALDNARLFGESAKAKEDLAHSNRHLRDANADLEQFAYSASHDLREPLRHVAVYSQLLQRRFAGQIEPEANDLIRVIVDSAHRMDALVSGLLTYTQALNVVGDQSTPIDANSVLNMAIANLQVSIQESGAVIDRAPLPFLNIQQVHLLQLFQNLVGNAVKYRGDDPPRIRIAAQRENNLWRISVDDNGIGIPSEYGKQIFGLFKRLHTSDKYSGTGIGLALCQKIVQRYGGRIWVESHGLGTGSRFCFTLPGPEPPAQAADPDRGR